MTKSEMASEIPKLCALMEKEVIECGVGKKRWASLSHDIEVRHFRPLQSTYKFLKELEENEYGRVARIRGELPQATWDNYKLLGYTDMPEQITLKAARLALLRKVRSFKIEELVNV